MKPSKPGPFEGKKDFLVVKTWLYQLYVYLNLLQVVNPNVVMDVNSRVMFAITLLKGQAANLWYRLFQAGQAPVQWKTSKRH